MRNFPLIMLDTFYVVLQQNKEKIVVVSSCDRTPSHNRSEINARVFGLNSYPAGDPCNSVEDTLSKTYTLNYCYVTKIKV
jgi:hypothetical protein